MTVRDNKAKSQFELDVDGFTAFAEYRRANGEVTFIHTEVPEQLGGRGIGSTLAKGALALVRADGESVAATCPFIAGYLDKHPEYDDLRHRR